jgi:arylsulfatase A-like enzyme
VTAAFVPGSARAGCTQSTEASAVKKSVKRDVQCNDRKLRSGPTAQCNTSAPPPCSASLVDDAVALGYGPNDPPAAAVDRTALKSQLTCQKQIGKGVYDYVGRYLSDRVKGRTPAEADARARRQLDKLPDRCAVTTLADTSGVVLPAVGPQCAAAVGDPGDAVDAEALRDCLRTLLQVWVDRIFGANPQPLRPNILFILTDDQRWDTTGGTHGIGAADVMPRTRAELGGSGVEFTEAFMTTPVCCPSRASILAGQYAHRTGVYKNGGNNGGADDFVDESTIATWLQDAGYRTSLLGKYLNGYQQLWEMDVEPPYVPPGWTEWRGLRRVSFFDWIMVEPDGLGGYDETLGGSAEADYLTDVMREKAKTFISGAVGAGEPFFLYLSFKAPHLPQIPAPRHEGLFEGIPDWRPPSYNEPDVSDKPTWLQNTPQMDQAEQDDLDQVRVDQLEMLQAIDEAIGGSTTFGITGIMQHLRDLGVADDTIVVFFADNGWHWGEHRTRAKLKPYEESIRSPMFVHYPKLAPLPRREALFALNIDLAPTFAELAGAAVPIAQDGTSLVRVIDGTQPPDEWRTDFLTEGWPNNRVWASVRNEQWKYNELPVDPTDPETTFELELYDLVNDPYEEASLHGDPQHAVRIAEMAARLRQLRPNWPVDANPNGPDPDEDD